MALTEMKGAKPTEAIYRLADGRSLYLKVLPSGGNSRKFRFERNGTVRADVLGSYPKSRPEQPGQSGIVYGCRCE